MADNQPTDIDPSDARPQWPVPEDAEAFQDRLVHLQVAATEAYEALSEAASQLTKQAQAVYAASQDVVRGHPAAYTLGAFALGVVLGMLSARD